MNYKIMFLEKSVFKIDEIILKSEKTVKKLQIIVDKDV